DYTTVSRRLRSWMRNVRSMVAVWSSKVLASAVLLSLIIHPTPTSTLFPYTTLFRSDDQQKAGTLGDRRPGNGDDVWAGGYAGPKDRKSTRLNSSHVATSYAVFCLKKKTSGPPGGS